MKLSYDAYERYRKDCMVKDCSFSDLTDDDKSLLILEEWMSLSESEKEKLSAVCNNNYLDCSTKLTFREYQEFRRKQLQDEVLYGISQAEVSALIVNEWKNMSSIEKEKVWLTLNPKIAIENLPLKETSIPPPDTTIYQGIIADNLRENNIVEVDENHLSNENLGQWLYVDSTDNSAKDSFRQKFYGKILSIENEISNFSRRELRDQKITLEGFFERDDENEQELNPIFDKETIHISSSNSRFNFVPEDVIKAILGSFFPVENKKLDNSQSDEISGSSTRNLYSSNRSHRNVEKEQPKHNKDSVMKTCSSTRLSLDSLPRVDPVSSFLESPWKDASSGLSSVPSTSSMSPNKMVSSKEIANENKMKNYDREKYAQYDICNSSDSDSKSDDESDEDSVPISNLIKKASTRAPTTTTATSDSTADGSMTTSKKLDKKKAGVPPQEHHEGQVIKKVDPNMSTPTGITDAKLNSKSSTINSSKKTSASDNSSSVVQKKIKPMTLSSLTSSGTKDVSLERKATNGGNAKISPKVDVAIQNKDMNTKKTIDLKTKQEKRKSSDISLENGKQATSSIASRPTKNDRIKPKSYSENGNKGFLDSLPFIDDDPLVRLLIKEVKRRYGDQFPAGLQIYDDDDDDDDDDDIVNSDSDTDKKMEMGTVTTERSSRTLKRKRDDAKNDETIEKVKKTNSSDIKNKKIDPVETAAVRKECDASIRKSNNPFFEVFEIEV